MLKARCQSCGYVFESMMVEVVPGSKVEGLSFFGNTETCPRCGGRSKTDEGHFNVDENGVFHLVKEISPRERARLKFLLEEARNGKISSEDFLKKAETVNPLLSELKKFRPQNVSDYINLVMMLFAALEFFKDDAPKQTIIEKQINIHPQVAVRYDSAQLRRIENLERGLAYFMKEKAKQDSINKAITHLPKKKKKK